MYLGIDCGTQGTKVVVLDAEQGILLGEGYSPHELISLNNGRREQQPQWWTEALVRAYGQAIAQAGINPRQIAGIGISGQQHGLVTLDRNGQILRPAKLWCDTESTTENNELLDYLGGADAAMERLGLVIAPGYTVSKLLWMKRHFADEFSRIAHILLPHDYLNYWLTGEFCAEYGDASGSGYFDIRQRCWDTAILDHIDGDGHLRAALPALIESHQPAGVVRAEIAGLLGLGPDVVVSSGGGDNMMGAIGTGNIRQGIITMSLGTSGTVYAHSDKALVSPNAGVAAFCSSAGGWLPLICTMNLTSASSAVQKLFQLDIAGFNDCLQQAPVGAEGITMLPFLNGERVPALPQASASILGINSLNLTQSNLCRAVVEGTTFGLRYGLDLLRDAGLQGDTIRLIGGGAKSALWRQIVADTMNARVVCPVIGEAAALGGAIQAAWCVSGESLTALTERCVQVDDSSEKLPVAADVAASEEVYQRYRQALQQLHGV
ncbi:xylulose kinase [Pokkaliibacter plantistimulans]|uniref:Xylulose kinase n=1 Tax=Pokkaliibacter plantistimulans TaxID=1635171 RepID=A0ABX5LTL5_9GAMM|nr:xylulokinase [Pokkaliibacter plantistimulans]PXF28626.1 xylulose kinase [Pokkaliibacter plantistimulans]